MKELLEQNKKLIITFGVIGIITAIVSTLILNG